MFAPVKMAEVDIFAFEDDIDIVAQTAARLGVIHLLDVNSLGKWAVGTGNEWPGRASSYATQERRVTELLDHLQIPETFVPCDAKLNPAEDLTLIEKTLQEIESRAQALQVREVELRRDQEHAQLVARSMEILSPLSISISDLRQTEYLHIVAGTIPLDNLARLEASLFRIPYRIIPVHRYGDRVLIFAFSAQEHGVILDHALESAFLDPLELPVDFNGTAQEILNEARQRAQADAQELNEVAEQRRKLADEVSAELLELLTMIRRNRTAAEAMSHFGHRGRVYLIAGWVPENKVAQLREAVEDATRGRISFEVNSPFIAGEDRVPTLLRNSKMLRPIESLVSTYGIPGYRELDPTLLVAITFVLMFGIMFGDLGHGLVLVLSGVLLYTGRIPRLIRFAPAGVVLMGCGLASCLFGVLYGSVFGLEDLIPHLWLQPMNDILTLLLASVVFGVVVLNIGFGLKLLTALRARQFREILFDRNGVAGVLLYWCLIGMVLMAVTGHGVPGVLIIVALLLMVAMFLAQPLTSLVTTGKFRLEEGGNVGETMAEAFFELFESLIGYFSGTLSYVRLGAFAVAHAGLSMVVFLLAGMTGGGVIGTVLYILVLILGNLFIIGFEGLIVGIQTLRLEYYELFGKFFIGEGVPFKPLVFPETDCPPYQIVDEGSKA